MFFFKLSDAHPHLHSFPTRRSSDLLALIASSKRWAYSLREARVLTASRFSAELNERSEEHTSELQSLTNLVCRLLLEKKNANESITTSSCTQITCSHMYHRLSH